jgi:hypothetical protein
MYPNLKAEFARKNLTLADVVAELRKKGMKMTIGTLSTKMNKKNKKLTFSFDEAVALKQILNTDLPLEELFEEAR